MTENQRAPPEIPSLEAALNASQQTPFVVTITNFMGGPMHYEYKFKVTREGAQTDNLLVELQITRLPSRKTIRNHCKLLRHSPSVYVLVCTKLHNSRQVTPPITIPFEYRRRSRSWTATSSFANVRSVFSLNSFEDGFGFLATLLCNEMTVQFPSDGTMSIRCYAMGVLVNEAKPDDRNLMDLDDEDSAPTTPHRVTEPEQQRHEVKSSPTLNTPPALGPLAAKSSFFE